MIVIHPLKICYQVVPKIASTSFFRLFYRLIFGEKFDFDKIKKPVHAVFRNYKDKKVIENVPNEEFKKLPGYFSFTITREPVKRFLSFYRNRVLFFGDLDFSGKRRKKLQNEGLRARPEIKIIL